MDRLMGGGVGHVVGGKFTLTLQKFYFSKQASFNSMNNEDMPT